MKNLKKLRQKKKLSQVDTAKKVGVHINTYILWEKGVSNPNDKNLKKLKKILGEK